MFTEDNICNNSTLQKKISFEIDHCHNINPLFIKQFMFLVPPVCKNGTLAEYTDFQASNCWGNVWHSWKVSDMHVYNCLRTTADTKKLMSFALMCDGIKRNNSKARLIAALLLLFGPSLAVLGLLLVCIRGSLVLVSKTLGSLAWGLRTLVTIAKVSFVDLFVPYCYRADNDCDRNSFRRLLGWLGKLVRRKGQERNDCITLI
jgi:hypothetical protein